MQFVCAAFRDLHINQVDHLFLFQDVNPPVPPAVFALGSSAPCDESDGAASQPLPPAPPSPPPPPRSMEDSGGWPLFSSTF